MINKKIRLLIFALVSIVILLISWQFVLYLQHRGLTRVKIVVFPTDSLLTVDNKPTKPGNIYLKTGGHRFVASREDFGDDIKSINTGDIISGQTIYMLPVADSAAAINYLLNNPNIQQARESAGGAEAERTRTMLLKKYPVLAKLPQETLDYKISYSVDSSQKVTLVITTYGIINNPSDYSQYTNQTKKYRLEALDYLQKNGVGENTLTITYVPSL